MKYAVVLGNIGSDHDIFTYKVEASNDTAAINEALELVFNEVYSDVYDDAHSMINDGYDVFDVIPETFFND
jgi:hypothetical protein